jgi:hypothetical protein
VDDLLRVTAPTEHHPFEVAELVEQEQGVVAGALEVAVMGAALPVPYRAFISVWNALIWTTRA